MRSGQFKGRAESGTRSRSASAGLAATDRIFFACGPRIGRRGAGNRRGLAEPSENAYLSIRTTCMSRWFRGCGMGQTGTREACVCRGRGACSGLRVFCRLRLSAAAKYSTWRDQRPAMPAGTRPARLPRPAQASTRPARLPRPTGASTHSPAATRAPTAPASQATQGPKARRTIRPRRQVPSIPASRGNGHGRSAD